jgi:hypothetical protein
VSHVVPEYSIFYSLTAATNINRNPNCVSNGGVIADGAGACPNAGASWIASTGGALPANVTAIRVDDSNGLAANTAQAITVQLQTLGSRAGDHFENSFSAAAPSASLVVSSPKVAVHIVAGEIRGAVYADNDNSLTVTPADTGIPGVTLTLSGTDSVGNTYLATTTSMAAFSSASTVNTVQINGGTAISVTCSATPPLRLGEYLFCNLASANTAGYTLRETQPVDYVDGADNLGVLASGAASGGSPANDVFSGIRLTNNVITGVGDRGTGYNFGEIAQFANVSGRVYREASVPLNTEDDGEPEDPSLATQVALSCVPAYAGVATVSTDGFGYYQFLRVPVGATCIITETQPSGYGNAYNTRGLGAVADTGGTGVGNSSITLVVPATGSGGNNFAETQMADTTSTISCTPTNANAGQTVTCTAVCTNHGPAVATNMGCVIVNLAALVGAQLTGCQTVASVAVGGTIGCVVRFPLSPFGVTVVTAGSSAANDINGGALPTAGNNPSAASVGVLAATEVPISGAVLALIALLLACLAGPSLGRRRRSGSLRNR